MKDIKKKYDGTVLCHIKKGVSKDALTNGKLTGISVLNTNETILKKKLMFHSLFISVLVNTTSVSICYYFFEHTLYTGYNFWTHLIHRL